MAWTHRTGTDGDGNGTSVVIDAPAGLAENDVIYVWISIGDSDTTATPPDGTWTEQVDGEYPAYSMQCYAFTKVAGASEPSTYTFTLSAAFDYTWVAGASAGGDGTVESFGPAAFNPSGTVYGTPAGTPSVDGALIVAGIGFDSNDYHGPIAADSSPAATMVGEGFYAPGYGHTGLQRYEQATAASLALDFNTNNEPAVGGIVGSFALLPAAEEEVAPSITLTTGATQVAGTTASVTVPVNVETYAVDDVCWIFAEALTADPDCTSIDFPASPAGGLSAFTKVFDVPLLDSGGTQVGRVACGYARATSTSITNPVVSRTGGQTGASTIFFAKGVKVIGCKTTGDPFDECNVSAAAFASAVDWPSADAAGDARTSLIISGTVGANGSVATPTNWTTINSNGTTTGADASIDFDKREDIAAGTYDPTNGTNALGTARATVHVIFAASGEPPSNTVAPAVTGNEWRTQTLTTDDGTWDGSPTFTYQWQRDDSGGGTFGDITGETNDTYVLDAADVDCQVRCVVTGTNSGGSDTANSNAVTVGDLYTAPPAGTGRVDVCGNAVVDYSGAAAVTYTGPPAGTGRVEVRGTADVNYEIPLAPGAGLGDGNLSSPSMSGIRF